MKVDYNFHDQYCDVIKSITNEYPHLQIQYNENTKIEIAERLKDNKKAKKGSSEPSKFKTFLRKKLLNKFARYRRSINIDSRNESELSTLIDKRKKFGSSKSRPNKKQRHETNDSNSQETNPTMQKDETTADPTTHSNLQLNNALVSNFNFEAEDQNKINDQLFNELGFPNTVTFQDVDHIVIDSQNFGQINTSVQKEKTTSQSSQIVSHDTLLQLRPNGSDFVANLLGSKKSVIVELNTNKKN